MDPFVGEIRIFGCNFAPRGWALCAGQIIAISSNTALFSLLGTTYGGNGTTTFALPNFQGNATMHAGQGPGLSPRIQGEVGGSPNVTLLVTEMPSHAHSAQVNNAVDQSTAKPTPGGNIWSVPSASRGLSWYSAYVQGQTVAMSPREIGPTGGNGPHNNLMPYLALTICIATQGVFPQRN